jgi:hypothetical protein
MQRMQTPELQYDQKQADHTGQAGVQQILSVLSEAYAAQGNQVDKRDMVLTVFIHRLQDNVSGKARGRRLYCNTPTTDNADQKHYLEAYGEGSLCRPVALIGRASDSKSEGWGFESLLACHRAFRE